MDEYIAPAPAVIVAPAPVVEYITHAPAVFAAPAPVDKYIAPAPAVYAAPAPVVEHNTPVPAVYVPPAPVMEYLAPVPAPVEEYISPVPLAHTAPAPVVDFIAPSARTQFFSLSPASSDAETHFPAVTGTKSRRGIETPTSFLSRRRLVDETGHVLDVQVERVMRASVARLGYEWRRTKKREKQLAETLLHLSHELQSCPSHGHTVTLLGMLAGGRGPFSAIAGVVSRVGSLERRVEFHEDAILELERQGSMVDSLVAKVEEMDRLLAQLEHLSDLVAEVERDTAVRFEQAESLVNHVDELARRGQAELEGPTQAAHGYDGGPTARAPL